VDSIERVFADVRTQREDVFNAVKSAGMLCVRHRRQNPNRFSNHSWGCAIDLFFGSDVVDQGVPLAHLGNVLLFPFFNKHGWYWGAEFSGSILCFKSKGSLALSGRSTHAAEPTGKWP